MSTTRMNDVLVRDAMHAGVVSCAPETGAADIARTMADHSVHCVAVTRPAQDGRAERMWGIVSDLDLLSALAAPATAATAADLASEPVITVRPTLPLREAAAAMVRHGAHHVVVVDPERHAPVGVLSTVDVAAVLAREE
jgi:CBS domain-containing protein